MQSASPKTQELDEEEDDIQILLKNIPACIRCRQNHRRCDPLLPACRNCAKAGHTECVYLDPIIGEQVGRSQILALASRLRDLRAARAESSMSFEVGPPRVETRGLYFGSQACISASLLVPTPRAEEEKLELAPFFQSFLPQLYDEAPLTPDLQAFLLRNYRDNVHVLYPIFDDEELSLDTCADNLETAQTYSRQFRLNMICSTSCYCVPGRRQTQSFLLPLARVFHRKAMSDVDDATSDISIPALRNFAVMALNSLFAPDQGNLSQLVGLASRMCADLGVLRSDDRSLRRLFFAILCIERQVALTFDRPRFVPEPSEEISHESEPVELLSSLFSIQCSLRRESSAGIDEWNRLDGKLRTTARVIQELERPIPNLVSTLRETELLAAEQHNSRDSAICRTTASAVLSAHESSCFRTCLSPHWTFKACNVFLKNCPADVVGRASTEMQLALILLDRDAVRWPNCKYLLEQLRNT